jgi:hypothetical protein
MLTTCCGCGACEDTPADLEHHHEGCPHLAGAVFTCDCPGPYCEPDCTGEWRMPDGTPVCTALSTCPACFQGEHAGQDH